MRRTVPALLILVLLQLAYSDTAPTTAPAFPSKQIQFWREFTNATILSDGKFAAIAADRVFTSDNPTETWTHIGRLPVQKDTMLLGGSSKRFFIGAAENMDNKHRRVRCTPLTIRLFSVDAKEVAELPQKIKTPCAFASDKLGVYADLDTLKITRDGGQTWKDGPVLPVAVQTIGWVGKDLLLVNSRPDKLTLFKVDTLGEFHEQWSDKPDDGAICGFSCSNGGLVWCDSINGPGAWKLDSGKYAEYPDNDLGVPHERLWAHGDYLFAWSDDDLHIFTLGKIVKS